MTDNEMATQREPNGVALTDQQPKTLELNFQEVNYTLQNVIKGPTQILKQASGTLKSGRLTAILGPSGAGKSTLLNVLAAFKINGVDGQFLINGKPRDIMAYRKMSSYIPQNYVMLNLLTVEETLRVSADLKLPRSTTTEEKQKIINEIMDILQLKCCRQTLVRNISGGEHKRLSIGIELITNPPIMFFDEPTSGLDSVASYQVICHLQSLAKLGRIVVCVVHQPSSRLMRLFDDVLIMAHGEVLYAGEQKDMLTTFSQFGYNCPQYYNPADFVLEVGSESSSTQRCEDLILQNKLRHSIIDKNSCKFHIDESAALLNMPPTTLTHSQELGNMHLLRLKERVGFFYQLKILLKRHLRSMSRDMMAVQLRILMHIIVALLLGVVYWQIGNDASKIVSNVSCLFFIILFVFAGNAMPSILLCIQDSAVFIREYYNGWYSLRAYYISKVLADLPLQLICPTLFISIGYLMTGQPPELFRFVMCWGILVMTSFIGHFIGVVAGTSLTMQLAIFIVPSVAIPFLLFSGFFIRLRELSWFLRPICDISFFRYIFEGLLRAIYGYNRGELACSEVFCFYHSSEQFLKDFDMLGDHYSWDITVLMGFVLVLLLAFYIALQVSIKRALR
ncbi:uncharacterized protein Dwil_GK18117, isoform C [Drosophila willistoni]|uniref:Uncharacterized protein, isoform C n=1 Tax=Drosophila willistoni TaxID=7260 RepID=B4MZA9_DROWI|nr:ATP-binding cassette sub-family G member 4 isoform X1 [Drosophila willistoni]EDW77382.2 uncharacterized protein Dwil_GK18117, isoform C [Drosophila willistoni]